MLLRFRFSNFRSFRDAQELSLVAAEPGGCSRKVRGFEERVLPVAAIYGANASGKSNVLKALQFMKEVVQDSHRFWKPDTPIPRQPFALDPECQAEPSEFSMDLLIGARRFQYGFWVDNAQVVKEWLYAFPGGKKQVWFARAGRRVTFGRMLRGPNRQIAALMRHNSLYLSVAAQNAHVDLSPLYRFFSKLVVVSENRGINPDHFLERMKDSRFKSDLLKVIHAADLGILAVHTQQFDTGDIESQTRKMTQMGIPETEAEQLAHETYHRWTEIQVHHKAEAEGHSVAFDIHEESNGTKALLALIDPVSASLSERSVICIDELEVSLHNVLGRLVIQTYMEQKSATSAQLIFATHDTNLLHVLSRDQIWFTEKDKNGVSHLYPLSDFKPQPNENLETGYLQGRYGAIPFIDINAFLTALTKNNGKK